MDIHAKFALVDGRAYADGHNWLTTPVQDVVMADGNDFAAIQTVLRNLSTTPSNGTFTTDKQQSLLNESNYLQTLLTNGITTGNEYDFITESFSTVQGSGYYNDDVYDGMCAIAQTGATMHVVVEEFSGYSATAKAALQNLELIDANASVRTDDNGHEKIRCTARASAGRRRLLGSGRRTRHRPIFSTGDWTSPIPACSERYKPTSTMSIPTRRMRSRRHLQASRRRPARQRTHRPRPRRSPRGRSPHEQRCGSSTLQRLGADAARVHARGGSAASNRRAGDSTRFGGDRRRRRRRRLPRSQRSAFTRNPQ